MRAVEKKSNNFATEEDEEADNGDPTNNGELKSFPVCNWVADKCFCEGGNVCLSLCHRSGCSKFAHQYCQDQ